MSAQIQQVQPKQNGFAMEPQTFKEAQEYAQFIASSNFVPKEFKGHPADVLVACQMGAELGLKPLQSLQNIAVINGKPVVWGDAMIAIVRSRPDCESIQETFDESRMTATCVIKRRNQPEEARTFSEQDARTAKLWGNNTWAKYPKRMLQMRARAFALRDVFGDALKGFQIAEEVQDYDMKNITPETNTEEVNQRENEPSFYPDDKFTENFPKWELAISTGKKTADEMINLVNTKATLTQDQENMIREVAATIEAEQVAWARKFTN